MTLDSTEATESMPNDSNDPTDLAREAAAVYVRLSKLTPWVKNPRKNDPAVPGIVRSIIRWGFGNPLLVRLANGEVIAGHTRIKAVKALKRDWIAMSADERAKAKDQTSTSRWHPEAIALAEAIDPELPVRYRDLSEKEAHLLALADNKTGEVSEWDNEGVEDFLRECSLSDIMDAGWTGSDLDDLTSSLLGDDEKPKKEAKLDETFSVVIECTSEDQQLEVLAWAQEQDLKCRALI